MSRARCTTSVDPARRHRSHPVGPERPSGSSRARSVATGLESPHQEPRAASCGTTVAPRGRPLSTCGRAELREGGGNGGGGGRGGKGGGDLVGGGGGGEGFRGGGGLGGRGGGLEGGEGGGGILRGGGGGGDGGFGGGGGGGGNGSSLPLKTFISPSGGVATGLTPVSQPHTPPNQLELGGGGSGSASAGARRASYLLRRGICAAPLRPRWRLLGALAEAAGSSTRRSTARARSSTTGKCIFGVAGTGHLEGL